jgi:hypothetical protein
LSVTPPQQLALAFALWTRRAIGELIGTLFWVRVQAGLIGKYLKRLGFTPQRPLKRASGRRPEQVVRWLNETYPVWVAKARAKGAVIYSGDETAQ